jgi:hypothetical protein
MGINSRSRWLNHVPRKSISSYRQSFREAQDVAPIFISDRQSTTCRRMSALHGSTAERPHEASNAAKNVNQDHHRRSRCGVIHDESIRSGANFLGSSRGRRVTRRRARRARLSSRPSRPKVPRRGIVPRRGGAPVGRRRRQDRPRGSRVTLEIRGVSRRAGRDHPPPPATGRRLRRRRTRSRPRIGSRSPS